MAFTTSDEELEEMQNFVSPESWGNLRSGILPGTLRAQGAVRRVLDQEVLIKGVARADLLAILRPR